MNSLATRRDPWTTPRTFNPKGPGVQSHIPLKNPFTNKGKENKMALSRWKTLLVLLTFMLGTLAAFHPAEGAEVSRITKEEAREMLGKDDVVFLDVRTGSDWNASDLKITGAVHEDAQKWKDWISKYDKGKTYILYCA